MAWKDSTRGGIMWTNKSRGIGQHNQWPCAGKWMAAIKTSSTWVVLYEIKPDGHYLYKVVENYLSHYPLHCDYS